MKIFNITTDTCELKHIDSIFNYLNESLNDEWGLYVRRHNQEDFKLETKYGICIILSAEGHSYIPPEVKNMKVFMNYPPKNNNTFPHFFNPNDFVKIPNLFELQLGTAKWFNTKHDIDINERMYDISFIGQYDPYTRVDFYKCAIDLKTQIDRSYIHFYEGWNNGIGSEKYSEIMSQTKIALVPYGSASLDTFRFYEAMSCGCVVMSINQNNYEFMNGCPYLKLPNWNPGLIKECIQSISQKDFSALSLQSRKFWETNLSPKASASFILNKIKEN